MLLLLIVAMICITFLGVGGGVVWLLYQPVKVQAAIRAAEMKMNMDLHEINMDTQRQRSAMDLQRYLRELDMPREHRESIEP